MVKKTAEQKAAEELRYIAAKGAVHAADLEPFLTDSNQSIRAVAVHHAARAKLEERGVIFGAEATPEDAA